MIANEKDRLRTELQNALRTFGVAARHQASSRIHDHLFRSPLWQRHQCWLLFSALPGEPRTVEILRRAVEEGKTCVYPRVLPHRAGMKLYRVKSSERLIRGNFGILEPDANRCEPASFQEVDAALVPGLGFDHAGHRLGRGFGYYDRLLADAAFKGVTIGTHFECQLLSHIPVETHDRHMAYLLNEAGLIAARL